MKTYKRIEELKLAVQSLMSNFDRSVIVCDIGTDHGYLAKEISLLNKIKKVIATDISSKSLSKLQNLIKAEKLSKIETIVGDGLKPIDFSDIAVIAGLGGYEIIKILRYENITINGEKKCKYFVLQPTQNFVELRRFLFKNHIHVISDKLVVDSGRYYPIIVIDVTKVQKNICNVYNLYLGRDNNLNDIGFQKYVNDISEFLNFLNDIPIDRIKRDKITYEKYKLKRLIDKMNIK